ncbi:amidase [Streptacidiphilus jiangxiensis]|uniref:Aspartyl-tRNA(Asn)/glutamyl-tRNA(Gln) amidotransferase subunit A n=1 Tax=Streptacidiphilus jiangxiensis TaxID=235985 RepID=A0A1H7YMX5_STRJI|nr:amidase [Streptacidiphilus jiangxiensis]SEM47281.1 aspartyl-tRNA(Asn)/glutamyl-tRNA(Gln) amidotransferase subunit A [Streptacidiphilus jiangxiensis]
MDSLELAYLPATDALRAFRSRNLSPVELMEAVIDRAERTEPDVNCLSERLFEEGLAAAREAEKRYAGHGPAPRALEGLPVAAKDEHPIAGRLCTEGSLLLADEVAEETHPVITRVQAAGGIIHARTTTPEFCCAAFTQSKLWGVTRNPWSLGHSCGGSSGGSGAALAAGNAPLATGSDIGGSIRIPASFNGVVGFKPPYGRVPSMPPFNLDTFCHDGPMARTVADTVLLQNTIAGPWPGDVVSMRPKLELPSSFEGVAGLRIALCVNLGDYDVDPDVEANTRAVADALREAGAVVEEVRLGWTRELLDQAAWAHFGAIFGPSIGEAAADSPELLTGYARAFAERAAEAAGKITFLEGLELEGRLYAELGAVLERYDALLCPTTAVPALAADDEYTQTRLTIAGVEQEHYMAMAMTIGFNICSRCPVLSVPSGFAANGVPTGVQIVGRTYDDETVFRVGAAVEQLRPWAYVSGRRPLV